MDKTPINKPIKDLDLLDMQIDCFGNEYDQMAPECQYCSANVACSVVYFKRHTKKKIKEIAKEQGHFLDEVDFDTVPFDKIAAMVRDGKDISSKDTIDVIMRLGKCKDYGLASKRLLRFLSEEGFRIEKGLIKTQQ
jgi:hypothetical protein